VHGRLQGAEVPAQPGLDPAGLPEHLAYRRTVAGASVTRSAKPLTVSSLALRMFVA
jgi:hypothetical protein